jgi:hypothetical protein
MEPITISVLALSGLAAIAARFVVGAANKWIKPREGRKLEIKLPSGDVISVEIPVSMSREEADKIVEAKIAEATRKEEPATSAQ